MIPATSYSYAVGAHLEIADSPERALWGAVVIRATQDVGLWFSHERRDREYAKEAVRWLFGPLSVADLHEVCANAGINPERAKKFAKELWLTKVPPDYQEVREALWREVISL